VLFAVVHLGLGMNLAQALITFFSILLVGVLLGAMRWHYQRLGPSMVAHALFNAVAVVVLFAV
jgi:membrane protease YdiL (CAAX protease family)